MEFSDYEDEALRKYVQVTWRVSDFSGPATVLNLLMCRERRVFWLANREGKAYEPRLLF